MAGFTEQVRILIDVVSDKAASSLGQLKTKIGEAEGGFGKLKAAGSGAFDMIAQAGPVALAGVATAVATFAAKSIAKFQDTAIAADKFSKATGLGVEEASRWIEVASDVGIGAETVQTAFGKMEKAIAANRAAFGDLVVTAKDGSVDLNATFLNVIEHLQGIKDPLERANEASKLFGRGFQGMAELLGTSADQLRTKLAAVSDEQAINPEEAQRALEARDAFKNFEDEIDRVQIAIGQYLIPVVAAGAEGLTFIIQTIHDTVGALDELRAKTGGENSPFMGWGDILAQAKYHADVLIGAFHELTGTAPEFEPVEERLRSINEGLTGLITGPAPQMGPIISESAYAALQGVEALNAGIISLNNTELANVSATFAVHAAQQAVVEAFKAADEAGQDTSKTALEQQIAYDKAAQAAINLADKNRKQAEAAGGAEAGNQAFIDTLNYLASTASPNVKAALDGVISKLKTTGDQKPNPTVTINNQTDGPITGIRGKLTALDSTHATPSVGINDQTAGPLAAIHARLAALANAGRQLTVSIPHAAGGPVAPGVQYLVGEKGPELFVSKDAGAIVPADQTRRMMSASGSATSAPRSTGTSGTTIINNFPAGTDPTMVVAAQKRYLARNGSR